MKLKRVLSHALKVRGFFKIKNYHFSQPNRMFKSFKELENLYEKEESVRMSSQTLSVYNIFGNSKIIEYIVNNYGIDKCFFSSEIVDKVTKIKLSF